MHARARPGRGSCSAQHLLTGALAEMKRASAAAEYPGSLSRPKLHVIWAGRTPPPFCAAGGGVSWAWRQRSAISCSRRMPADGPHHDRARASPPGSLLSLEGRGPEQARGPCTWRSGGVSAQRHARRWGGRGRLEHTLLNAGPSPTRATFRLLCCRWRPPSLPPFLYHSLAPPPLSDSPPIPRLPSALW